MSAPLDAILFDLDNTLYPEEQFVRSGFHAVAEYVASRLCLDAHALETKMMQILEEVGRGQVFDILLREFGLDPRVWGKTLLLVYRSHTPTIELFPEVPALLDLLKSHGVLVGLVTDGIASVQRRKIGALGLEQRMDVLVCTDELGDGCAKPSCVPFEVALTILNVTPGRAAYVADDASKDFVGPNQLGMKSVRLHSTGLLGVSGRKFSEARFQPSSETRSLGEVARLLQIVCA
jgi:putative hydrolase of the HAD superfamily